MDWRTTYADRLVTADHAAGVVKNGDVVWMGMFTSTPETISRALLARHKQLENVTIHHYVSPFVWATPDTAGHLTLVTAFTTPADRTQVHAGKAEYLPLGNFRQTYMSEVLPDFDVCYLKTSAPDENGWMSLGTALWANRTVWEQSNVIICEVDERLIRTHGENFLHVSQVAHLVEHDAADDRQPPIPPRSDEVAAATEVIGTLVASELIHDGDTLQIGIGDVTAALALFLGDKRDIGIQTELIPGGIVDMVERGVITGARKQVAPGRVVGSAFAVLPPDEAARVHNNPTYELWDFCHTDDLRVLVQERDFVAINNALQIDLTGQVTAESLNGRVFSGPGGQTVFAIASSYSEGGRSIIALPSSSTVDGARQTRVVGALPPGAMVTVPRTYVDYVVTEQGIAKLRGKTVRQRAREMIAIAHPDCRDQLTHEAKALGYI